MKTDPSVSPADTIRRAIALGDHRTWAYDVSRSPRDFDAAYAALDEWEAAGERDGRQIAQLTEALEAILGATSRDRMWAIARAVLADEEDAANG